jgi:hypothetical protein
MNARGSKLSFRFQAILFSVGGLLTLSGGLWLLLHYGYPIQDEFGTRPNLWEKPLIRWHGAGAMAWLLVLGALLQHHVRVGLRHKRRIISGLTLLGINLALVVTGYGLYYAGDETLRNWSSLAHSVLGFAVVGSLIAHLFWRRSQSSPPLRI